MDKVTYYLCFVLLWFSVIAAAVFTNPETDRVVRGKSITELKGSNLKMVKTARERMKSNQSHSKSDESRSVRNALFGKRDFTKRGQTMYSSAYGNDRNNEDFPGEKYLHLESGNNKPWYYSGEVSDGRIPVIRRSSHSRRPIERNSCKQYIEFLKYAFEQIENSRSQSRDDQEFDYSYDDGYNNHEVVIIPGKAATSESPVIIPDAVKLRSLTYGDNYETENNYSYVRKEFVNETEIEIEVSKQPEGNGRMLQSTESSELGPRSVESFVTTMPTTGETISPVTAISTVVHRTPVHKTFQISKSITTEKIEAGGRVSEGGCQDKFFPCPDNMNVTYPVNGYCNRFVVCESGRPNSEFCQEGLHFNLIAKECDLPRNSFCTYSCPNANGYFAIPGDCGGFFRCSDWYPEYRMCPPRMHWDSKAKICTFRELSSCPLKCDSSYQVKPYDGVCNSYIICTRGIASYHTCPDGMNFDKSTLTCLSENKSRCQDDSNYITRNQGMENGRKLLCAKVELKGGESTWCQDTRKRRK